MSQSSKINRIFGSVQIQGATPARPGSLTSVAINTAPAPTTLAASATIMSAAQMLTGVLTINPAAAVSLAFDAAVSVVSSISQVHFQDSFDFSVLNLASVAANTVTVSAGTGGTLVGSGLIASASSAEFRVFVTGLAPSQAYTVYRV